MAQHETQRVEVLCLDAIGTIFTFRRTREELLAAILQARYGIIADPKFIADETTRLRRAIPRGNLDMDAYWEERINPRLFRRLGIRGSIKRKIRRVRRVLFSTPEHFMVRKDMRQFIEHFGQRTDVQLAIASNHDLPLLLDLLRHFDLDRHFAPPLIFTSQQLGHSKPSREYFECIRKACKLKHLEQIALIGNSLENDGFAWQHGMRVCVIDVSGSLMRLRATIPSGITPARMMRDVWPWVHGACGIEWRVGEPISDDGSDGHANEQIVTLARAANGGK
ncbi:MAG: HAD hydrolase-like protein [bacterium]|nr:HAD hydrolase-like protein [bacterium]